MIRPLLKFLCFTVFLFFLNGVQASFFDKLIMPGPLYEGHAEFEDTCEKCHESFDKANQIKRCLACHDHKNIADDIKQGKGFHGNPKVRISDCKACHTEHIGRNADIIQIDLNTFNHKQTDFDLKGKHLIISCQSCHKKDKKYHEATDTCYSCHKEDDKHEGGLGKKCEDCHSEKTWQGVKYDHKKETKFELIGNHKDAPCDACHLNSDYKDAPIKCYSCHKINDIHQGKRGKKCDVCHTPLKWKKNIHTHDKKKFKLKGVHPKLNNCTACHKTKKFTKVKQNCLYCHQSDDIHKGRYGEKCQSCHNQKNWLKQSFDHDETDFKLKGKHQKVHCDSCHRGVIETEKIGTLCSDCHKHDDVHKRKDMIQCDQCHNETGWSKDVLFDHDQSRFPLIGLHSIVSCESCHEDSRYRNQSVDCVECHQEDDIHEERLGLNCDQCHNPNDWRIWHFDHNTETDFSLDGIHEEINCEACHDDANKDDLKLPARCISCHRSDDSHNGRFGPNCDRCHTTSSFRDTSKLNR